MNTDFAAASALQKFNELVGTRFQLYNSLFTSLPFHRIEKTGVLLTLFLMHCEEGYQKHLSPEEIIETFIDQYTSYTDPKERLDLLFRFVQYAERQIVLFDALEDAAFTKIRDTGTNGVLQQVLQQNAKVPEGAQQLHNAIKDIEVRLVLTAHPTQFYPGEVLGIIHDLSKALTADDTTLVNAYLRQLGKTPFMKKEKPSPYDEATNMMWFLENVFYPAAGNILKSVQDVFPGTLNNSEHPLIRMGFWPGGDRDGNQFVKADSTLKVGHALRERLLRRYYHDIRIIRRRLTFKGVAAKVIALEKTIFSELFEVNKASSLSKNDLLMALWEIRQLLIIEHNSLFLELVDDLIGKVKVFGLFFATLDIRQDSSVHSAMLDWMAANTNILPEKYPAYTDHKKIETLLKLKTRKERIALEDDVQQDILDVMGIIKELQQQNGEEGCNRYIISHCTSALNVLEVFTLFQLSGWDKETLSVDIVPLFETIQDLQMAAEVMDTLYSNQTYLHHLKKRNGKQTIMLGFSDGTKDGGYLMANWSIYKAKEALSKVSAEYGIDVIFFDGRGGPPARGGGKTQKFYSSMGSNIASNEIQLTIQGQTVSSNFGTIDTAQYNIEQLLHAGIYNKMYSSGKPTLTTAENDLLNKLSEKSFEAYTELKEDPNFLEYLSEVSPLRFYANTNIGSRPAKRNSGEKLTMNDLRAIPFVGSWSQLKQNVSGFYGVGSALQKIEEQGGWDEMKNLYRNSQFFKALLDNCEMALRKCYFPLTAHLAAHPKFGDLWNRIHDEYLLTEKQLLRLSDKEKLMEDEPVSSQSILMRERIVLPLVTIQQFGLIKMAGKNDKRSAETNDTLEKLITRCSFGIINAGRNSA